MAIDNNSSMSEILDAFKDLLIISGKDNLVNLIGSPASITNTIDELIVMLQSYKNTLATNLTSKGITSVGTDTMANLVNAVTNISIGKKFDSGIINGGAISTGGAWNYYTINKALEFDPNFIIAIIDSAYPGSVLFFKDSYISSEYKNVYLYNRIGQTGADEYSIYPGDATWVVTPSNVGFVIPYNASNFSYATDMICKWWAFE